MVHVFWGEGGEVLKTVGVNIIWYSSKTISHQYNFSYIITITPNITISIAWAKVLLLGLKDTTICPFVVRSYILFSWSANLKNHKFRKQCRSWHGFWGFTGHVIFFGVWCLYNNPSIVNKSIIIYYSDIWWQALFWEVFTFIMWIYLLLFI